MERHDFWDWYACILTWTTQLWIIVWDKHCKQYCNGRSVCMITSQTNIYKTVIKYLSTGKIIHKLKLKKNIRSNSVQGFWGYIIPQKNSAICQTAHTKMALPWRNLTYAACSSMRQSVRLRYNWWLIERRILLAFFSAFSFRVKQNHTENEYYPCQDFGYSFFKFLSTYQ